jgi:hypothetical protein
LTEGAAAHRKHLTAWPRANLHGAVRTGPLVGASVAQEFMATFEITGDRDPFRRVI